MVSISIELTDEEAARLKERAAALALAPEQLAAAVLRDDLNEQDEEFERLARRIVEKNRDLYARLA
jgi:type II secretory pathway component PulK